MSSTVTGVRRRPSSLLVAVTVVTVPLLVAVAVAVWGRAWLPVGDDALIAIDVRGVWSGEFPLLGAYSRFGWRHPGPALFWTLAPFDALVGVRGLVVGAAVTAVVATAANLVLLWRRGGALLGLVGGAALVGATGMLRGDVFEPWNPTISLLPFVTLVLATWAVTDGDWWAFPVVAGLGSWLVQVHVGYAAMTAGLVVVAVVAVALGARRGERVGRPVLVAVAVAVVLWIPAIVETVVHWPGNLRRLAGGFLDPPQASLGLGSAVGVVARAFATPWAWVRGLAPENVLFGAVDRAPAALLVVPVAVSAGAAVLAWRRRDVRPGGASALRFQLVVWVTAGLAVVSTADIHGEPFPYLFRWLWLIGLLTWGSAAWSVAVALLPAAVPDAPGSAVVGPRVPRGVLAAAWGVFAVVCVVTAASVASRDLPFPDRSDTVRALVAPVARAVAGDGPVLVDSADDPFVTYSDGLAAALEAKGIEVWRPDSLEWRVGKDRVIDGRNPGRTASVVVGAAVAERRAAGETPVVDVAARGRDGERVAVFLAG